MENLTFAEYPDATASTTLMENSMIQCTWPCSWEAVTGGKKTHLIAGVGGWLTMALQPVTHLHMQIHKQTRRVMTYFVE